MSRFLAGCLYTGTMFIVIGGLAGADDPREQAIRKDRKQIAGTWRALALEVNGDVAAKEDARKITVVNGPDGSWSIRSDDQEISRGTSTIDPLENPKTIDITVTEGDGAGNLYLGIYELGENTRKLCFAPSGEKRPTDFYSAPGSQHIFVTFEREPAK